jgi:signal transduction histidine kinase
LILEYTATGNQWRFTLSVLRALLAVYCLGWQLLGVAQSSVALTVLWSVYLSYTIIAIFWRSLEQAGYKQFSLLIDLVFFLICASSASDQGIWLTSLFYLYVLLAAALLHTSREVFIVVGLTLGFLFLARPTQTVVLSPALLLTGTAVIVMALHRKALQVSLTVAARQTAILREEAEKSAEFERQRIAADLHDGPLQSFVGLQMRLEVLRKVLERDSAMAMQDLVQLQEVCKSQSAQLRAFVRSMRPDEVDGGGLIPSLRKLSENFEKESGFPTTFTGSDTLVNPETEVSLELLQIVREALHNVQKHSKATQVTVAVGKDDGVFLFSVEDNGTGFPFGGAYTLDELELLRLGPVSIRRRVRGLNGELMLVSTPGHGSSMKVRIPL